MFFKERVKPKFKDGDKRIVTRFCWLPTYALNGWLWLETVTLEQEAFNMYYEASHWVTWTTTKRISKQVNEVEENTD
jgi:hypothetical protein